jgi:hypothetical protein
MNMTQQAYDVPLPADARRVATPPADEALAPILSARGHAQETAAEIAEAGARIM